jgi:hypothetical protein
LIALKLLRSSAAVIAVAALFGSIAAAPAAAHWSNNGYVSAWYTVKPYSYNSVWQTPMDQTITNWNTHSKVNITKSSSSLNTVRVLSSSDTRYGWYSTSASSFVITLNSRTINNAASNLHNFIRSVFCHEIGHSLRLAHNSRSDSIMSQSRNRNTMYTFQAHDWSDVTDYYV